MKKKKEKKSCLLCIWWRVCNREVPEVGEKRAFMKILYSIHLEALWLCQLTKAPFISLNTTPLNIRGELLSVGSSFSSLQPSCLENKPQTIRSDSQAFLAGSTKKPKTPVGDNRYYIGCYWFYLWSWASCFCLCSHKN